MSEILGKGKRGTVYDNGDGTVNKITTFESECSEYHIYKNYNFKFIANVRKIGYLPFGDKIVYCIVKEKIDNDADIKCCIKNLEHLWDDNLISTHNLFDYFSTYLQSNFSNLPELHAVDKFTKVLLGKKLPLVFKQLIELIQELKDNNIYNVDWNIDNFGLKDNHLALFELGGTKIKLL